MKCARCSAEVPNQSQFCLRCGTPLTTTAAYPTPTVGTRPVGPARPNARPLLAVIAVLALLAVALGATVWHGLAQKSGQGPNAGLVSAPGASGAGPLVQAPGSINTAPLVQSPGATSQSPVVQAPGDQAPPPQDVIDYLAFLKKIEASKRKLISDEDNQLKTVAATLPADLISKYMNFDSSDNNSEGNPSGSDTADPKNRIADLSQETNKVADDWNELTKLFNERTPPQSCIDLRNAYLDQLGKIQEEVTQVYTVLAKAQGDPRAAAPEAFAMQGADKSIDTAMHLADRDLADVCYKYHLTKDFDIGEDGGGSLGGMLGIQ